MRNKPSRILFVMMLIVMLLTGLPGTTARADSDTYTTAG
jgi:hypothetical protein